MAFGKTIFYTTRGRFFPLCDVCGCVARHTSNHVWDLDPRAELLRRSAMHRASQEVFAHFYQTMEDTYSDLVRTAAL